MHLGAVYMDDVVGLDHASNLDLLQEIGSILAGIGEALCDCW